MVVPTVSPKAEASGQKRKRNNEVNGTPIHVGGPSFGPLGMEIHSDEENAAVDSGDEESESDHESFPELDAGDDSEDDASGEGDDLDEHDGSNSSNYLLEDSEDEVDVAQDEAVKIGPQATTVVSKITGRPKRVYPDIDPDYDSDSSTEDDPNRVGNIPMHWYDDLPHLGYDIGGRKVLRPAKGDELDKFLSTVDDPSSWTSAFDKLTQSDQQLTSEELDIIRRLQAAEVPDASYNPYEDTVEWFTGKGKEEVMPISARPEPKRRWQPSKWEKQKVMKIVRAIRQGRILPRRPTSTQPQFYQLWATPAPDHPPPLPAPKPPLPTNAESYNPPAEYLPTSEEKAEWEATDKEDRERNFLPQKYSALRLVPGYDQFIQERFSRLLDLYLAPRIQRKKLNIDPDSLLPRLPSPQSLKPFPIFELLRQEHGSKARCVAVSPDGVWVASGDESGLVKVWETSVGREAARYQFESRVGSIAWCPRDDVNFFVVGIDQAIHVLVPPYIPPAILITTLALLTPVNPPQPPSSSSPSLKWVASSTAHVSRSPSPLLTIQMPPSSSLVKQITFHRRGDYLASISESESVWIHQISKRHSQAPFKKIKGTVQRVQFHPTKPNFFVATQRYVRMYDLAAQKLLRTLQSGIRWISSLDIHPSGDHLIVGGYDRKLCWFDLELSEKPYKVLRYHSKAIRSLHFHPTYPLFASSSDDGTIQIFHARVFSDYLTDPLIVPLKVLRGHKIVEGLGVLEIRWLRDRPWLVSSGADGVVSLWCN